MLYTILMYIHMFGTLALFIVFSLTLTAMIVMLRTKKNSLLRKWSLLSIRINGLLPIIAFVSLLPGLYIVFFILGWQTAWMNVSLSLLIVLFFIAPAVNLRLLRMILMAVNSETDATPSPKVITKVQNRKLWNSILMMTMLTVAVVFITTMQPSLVISLSMLAIAIVIGYLIALLFSKANRFSTNHIASELQS